MIVRAFDADAVLRLVTQNDHAALAAEILSLWRADGLPEHPRREALLFATREHDNGWREVDAAPMVREDGSPHDFRSMPQPRRIELWHRGIERHATARPDAAALITQHAIALHRDREGDLWRQAMTRWRRRRDELLEAAASRDDAHGRETLETDYRFLDLADMISLVACAGWTERYEHRGITIEARLDAETAIERSTLALDPFPLAGATTFEVDMRLIDDRPYRGDAELALALAAQRRRRLRVRLVELRTGASLG